MDTFILDFFTRMKNLLPGFLLSVVIAFIASSLASIYDAPVMLFAVLSGLVCHFFYKINSVKAGVDMSSRALMRFAVALLGVRIAFDDMVSLGIIPPLMILVSMLLIIVFGLGLAKLLKLPRVFGVLSSGSVAVCGVSAAAAIATVLPKDEYEEKYFALTVIGVTTFGTFAMIFYPLVVSYLGLSDEFAGIFIGGSIHDVAQVVGAGYSISEEAGDIATYIKLLRVAMLLPIVMMIFFMFKPKDKNVAVSAGVSSFVPSFLIGFFILALLNNFGLIPDTVVAIIRKCSSYMLIIALSAIGVKTSLRQIVSVGWKPIVLIMSESFLFAILILSGIYLFLS